MPTGRPILAATLTADLSMIRGTSARELLAVLSLCAAGCSACGDKAECEDCFAQGYRVDLSSGASAAPSPAILFSGLRNGWCQKDLICTGTPDVFLGDIKGGPLDFPSTCEKQELVAFAGGHAPTADKVDPSLTDQTIVLNPARTVHVSVWVLPGLIPTPDPVNDAAKAQGVLATLGTGIDLQADVKPFPPGRMAEVAALQENASCDLVPALFNLKDNPADATDVPAFDVEQLNMYYVGGFSASTGAPAGLTCTDNTGALPPVMFLDGEVSSSPAVFAHELGHALGLIRSLALPGGTFASYNHTNELMLDPYLSQDNLMRSGGIFVNQVTLGQIYRMHFDELSWLWYQQPASGTYPRKCQDSPVDGGPCPALTRHPPRGWP